jgi:hypothetical protein
MTTPGLSCAQFLAQGDDVASGHGSKEREDAMSHAIHEWSPANTGQSQIADLLIRNFASNCRPALPARAATPGETEKARSRP